MEILKISITRVIVLLLLIPMASMFLICPHLFKFSPPAMMQKSTLEQGHISPIFGLPRIRPVPCISLELLDLAEPNAAL